MDIQRKAFESSNNVNPDWSFKFDEELQQYVATDFEMTNQVDEFNEHWDTFRAGWQAAKAQAVQAEFEIGQLKDRITELLDERQDLYAQIEAQKVVVPDTNISFKDWISDHKNDYVHFGGYQERAHELANRAWDASANTSTPKDKVLMPKKLSTKHVDYVVKELAITGGISLIEEVYQCLIEAQEPAND